jgi:hypothetical protein
LQLVLAVSPDVQYNVSVFLEDAPGSLPDDGGELKILSTGLTVVKTRMGGGR